MIQPCYAFTINHLLKNLHLDKKSTANLSRITSTASIKAGWLLSHKLIQTPYFPDLIDNLVYIQDCLERHCRIKYQKDDKVYYYLGPEQYSLDLQNKDINLNLLCYYYRCGYSTILLEGIGYKVIDPIGRVELVSLTNCNCQEFLLTKKCLHLTLATIHHSYRAIIYDQQGTEQSQEYSKV